jgi:small subunit ribosomal protein S20
MGAEPSDGILPLLRIGVKENWTNSLLSSKIACRDNEGVFWRIKLANTKSAIKRIKQNHKRRLRNRLFTGRARTFIKNARSTMEEGTPADARTATLAAISALDKAAEKGIIHKNNAARRKGRLMRRLSQRNQRLTTDVGPVKWHGPPMFFWSWWITSGAMPAFLLE